MARFSGELLKPDLGALSSDLAQKRGITISSLQVINSIQPGKEFTGRSAFRIRQRLTQRSDTLREKLADCHTRDTPRPTGCRCTCTLWFERKMRESKQNAMATSTHTRNDRDSMAPATAANGLRTVTRWRSTWLNHAYPLRRSPCRWSPPRRLLQFRCKTRKSCTFRVPMGSPYCLSR